MLLDFKFIDDLWKLDSDGNMDGSKVQVGDLKQGDDANNSASAVSKRKIVEQWNQSEPCKKLKRNILSPSTQGYADNCDVGFENEVPLFGISEQSNNCDGENTCTNNFLLSRSNLPMHEFCEANQADKVKETEDNSRNGFLSMSPVYDLDLKRTS